LGTKLTPRIQISLNDRRLSRYVAHRIACYSEGLTAGHTALNNPFPTHIDKQRIAQWFNNHGRTKREKALAGEEPDQSQPKRRRRPRGSAAASKGDGRESVESADEDYQGTPSSTHTKPPSFGGPLPLSPDNVAARADNGLKNHQYTEMKEDPGGRARMPEYLREARGALTPEEIRRYMENEELHQNIGKLDERLASWTSILQREVRACGIFMVAAIEPQTGLVVQKM